MIAEDLHQEQEVKILTIGNVYKEEKEPMIPSKWMSYSDIEKEAKEKSEGK